MWPKGRERFMRYLNGEWDRGAERDHHFPLLSSHFFLLTETFHRRKPSETIWPASVAMMDELCPEARSASANNIAAAERSRAVRTNP